MLYGEESVSIFTKCPQCKSKLKEATILLCGVYCKDCVEELTKNADETTKDFECKSCRRIHNIPEYSFMKWNALEEFDSSILPL